MFKTADISSQQFFYAQIQDFIILRYSCFPNIYIMCRNVTKVLNYFF